VDLAFWSGVREAKVRRLLVLMQARGWTDSGDGRMFILTAAGRAELENG
jgi:hypothetical protein